MEISTNYYYKESIEDGCYVNQVTQLEECSENEFAKNGAIFSLITINEENIKFLITREEYSDRTFLMVRDNEEIPVVICAEGVLAARSDGSFTNIEGMSIRDVEYELETKLVLFNLIVNSVELSDCESARIIFKEKLRMLTADSN